MKTLTDLGWDWRENGAIVSVVADGETFAWFIPLSHIRIVFGRELAAVGCPLQPSVGDPPTVSGFFKSLSRSVKKAARGVSRGSKRLARKAKNSVPKAIRRAASKVQRTAYRAYKTHSDLLKRGLAHATNVPVLGNFARLGHSALGITDRLARGKAPSLKQLGRMAKQGVFAAADTFAPGAGTLAQAGVAAGTAVAQGKRWDKALTEGGIAAASRYVPQSVARGALAAGTRIARGERIDRALTSGALTTARGYVPAGYARQAFDSARDIGGGKRIDRVVGRRLLKATNLRGLSAIAPSGRAMRAAQTAWDVAHRGTGPARRNTQRGIATLAARARKGDPHAREFLAAVRLIGRNR